MGYSSDVGLAWFSCGIVAGSKSIGIDGDRSCSTSRRRRLWPRAIGSHPTAILAHPRTQPASHHKRSSPSGIPAPVSQKKRKEYLLLNYQDTAIPSSITASQPSFIWITPASRSPHFNLYFIHNAVHFLLDFVGIGGPLNPLQSLPIPMDRKLNEQG